MHSKAENVNDYLDSLPEDRKHAVQELVTVIRKNLPAGFKEGMGYGMVGWVVPHTLFPDGYHCDPKLPVPFINLASQKNYISMHHLGLYGSTKLLDWLVQEWPKHSSKKLDMGKGCIRFKKMEDIPYDLIGELCSKMSPEQWLDVYQSQFVKGK
jgi:uncharacterized protein YdhG (YjbR/CyaY superfamily)